MRIESVRAAAVTDVTALGRGVPQPAKWHVEIDHMNPLAGTARYAGQAERFNPPWGETVTSSAPAAEFGWGRVRPGWQHCR